MNFRQIILNWIVIDAVATLLPLLFWSFLFELLSVEIRMFDNRNTTLAEIYFLLLIIDKIVIAAWVFRHKTENKLKFRALAYAIGSTFFIVIMLYITYLTFGDINWRT